MNIVKCSRCKKTFISEEFEQHTCTVITYSNINDLNTIANCIGITNNATNEIRFWRDFI